MNEARTKKLIVQEEEQRIREKILKYRKHKEGQFKGDKVQRLDSEQTKIEQAE